MTNFLRISYLVSLLISRRPSYGIVDFNEDDNGDNDDSIRSYCKRCLKFGFNVQLKNRIYPDGQRIPIDHENWKQCHECGLIVPVYELQKEATIKDVVETVENPFDMGKSFLGIDSRSARRKMKKKKELFGDINDPDLKRELASGQTRLISYTES
jgi:hypothetical protein